MSKRLITIIIAWGLSAPGLSAATGSPLIYGSAYSGKGGSATLYAISPTTGAATMIGPIGYAQVGALAFDVAGTLYGIGMSANTWMLITINVNTGAGAKVGPLGDSRITAIQDMDFRPSDGKLFAVGATSGLDDILYSVDKASGAVTQLGPGNSAFSSDGDALAFTSNNVLYTGNQKEVDVTNQTTGLRTFGFSLIYTSSFGTANPRTNAMKYDRGSGTLWASVDNGSGPNGNNNSIGTIDPATGQLHYIGPTIHGLDAIAIPPAAATQGSPLISKVVNAEGGGAIIAANTWVEIDGTNLASTKRTWTGSDFINNQMPVALDGVSVTMNGAKAYVYYLSATQINVLTPPNLTAGAVQVQVTTAAGSNTFTVQAQTVSPSFFVINGGPYIVATHADGSLVGPKSLYPGYTTPAAPGETIILYMNGFGAVAPPIVPGSAVQTGNLPSYPVLQTGGKAASFQFAGLISPGLYQFNVTISTAAANGDLAISASYNGQSTQPGTLLAVQQ